MRTVVAPAALRFYDACPGVGLTLSTAPFRERRAPARRRRERPALRRPSTTDSRCPRPFAASRCSSSPRASSRAATTRFSARAPTPGERARPVFLAGAATGLRLLAEGPWLSWFPFTFLARNPQLGLKPLPLTFGRRRYRTGLAARRAAEDLAPVRLLEDLVRDIALERLG